MYQNSPHIPNIGITTTVQKVTTVVDFHPYMYILLP